MNVLSNFKRGDTFSLSCTWKDNGSPASIAGLEIKAQIRNSYGLNLVDDLVVTPLNQVNHIGQFVLTPLHPDTSYWPIGSLICDLQITKDSVVRSSDSFLIPVIEDVTK